MTAPDLPMHPCPAPDCDGVATVVEYMVPLTAPGVFPAAAVCQGLWECSGCHALWGPDGQPWTRGVIDEEAWGNV